MMLVERAWHPDYDDDHLSLFTQRLSDFHTKQHFASGIDINRDVVWAKMTDQQAFIFLLQYPEYTPLFRPV